MDMFHYVFKKEIDWSALHQGINIPITNQVVFQKNMQRFLKRGESKRINLILDGVTYEAKLVNQLFDEVKNPNRKDILQIRYNTGSDIAYELRDIFSSSNDYIEDQRMVANINQKNPVKIPDVRKEYLVIYTTEYDDTYILESITVADSMYIKSEMVKEDEQKYETSINYDATDPTASIIIKPQLVKLRRLNRAISENLKLIYNYRCQICGGDFGKSYGVHIVEAHHIDHFVISLNNDMKNQIIICPNHHTVIHKANPAFDYKKLEFKYKNDFSEKITLNMHL